MVRRNHSTTWLWETEEDPACVQMATVAEDEKTDGLEVEETATRPRPLGFMDLPSDVRDLIYKDTAYNLGEDDCLLTLTWSREQTRAHGRTATCQRREAFGEGWTAYASPPTHLAKLAATNRQIFEQATPHVMSSMDLEIIIEAPVKFMEDDWGRSQIERMRLKAKKAVTFKLGLGPFASHAFQQFLQLFDFSAGLKHFDICFLPPSLEDAVADLSRAIKRATAELTVSPIQMDGIDEDLDTAQVWMSILTPRHLKTIVIGAGASRLGELLMMTEANRIRLGWGPEMERIIAQPDVQVSADALYSFGANTYGPLFGKRIDGGPA